MKIYRFLSAACLVAGSLFPGAPLWAQEAKTWFVNMPDSLCPPLTKVNRADCVDFMESKMKAQVTNRFNGPSEMTALGEDYVCVRLSDETSWQLKLLPLDNDTARVACVVNTACGPACDSSIRFYAADWTPLPASRFITLPAMDDFLTPADSTNLYAFDEARRSADMLLIRADLNTENDELTLTLTTPDYMSTETAEKLKPFLRRPLVYRWVGGEFIF